MKPALAVLIAVVLAAGAPLRAAAQVTLPRTFRAGDAAVADHVNENFNVLAAGI
jgi:hypothetical protein